MLHDQTSDSPNTDAPLHMKPFLWHGFLLTAFYLHMHAAYVTILGDK